MKILVAIPHYCDFDGGPSGATSSPERARAERVQGLGMCISALHRLFAGSQTEASLVAAEYRAANEVLRAEIAVIVATCQDRHILGELSAIRTAFEHHRAECRPPQLGFECHALLRERLGQYDYYCYIEDDLVLHDPWFFLKLRFFTGELGDDGLLQPNRFEFSRDAAPVKTYIDGEVPEALTAGLQNTRDRPEVVLPVLGAAVTFRRATNPHSACFFLNAAQMDHWARQPYFLDRDAAFIGPWESAATLGIMRTFRIYKPAVEYASFLEVQHWGDGSIRRFAQRQSDAQRKGQESSATKTQAMRLQKLGQGDEVMRLYEKALADHPSAQLQEEFRRLTVLTRRWEGRRATAPQDRLLFDGTYYYGYDPDGNRTSRCRKDGRGKPIDLTTYDWDVRKRLTAARRCGASGEFTEEFTNTGGTSGQGAVEGEEDQAYDGRNLFIQPNGHEGVPKIAFVSPNCVVDPTNGAALATLGGLEMLAGQGFECQAFCGTRFDAWEEVLVEESLVRQGLAYAVRNLRLGPHRGRLIFTRHGKVAVTLFSLASTRGACSSAEEARAFLTACELFLVQNRPDVVWTYGGDGLGRSLHATVKRLGIPLLFSLHNFAYHDRASFQAADYLHVPSEFSRRHYRKTLAVDCRVLPVVVNWERASVKNSPHPNPLPEGDGTGKYVTFINAHGIKGVYIFARIARELARRRPDIPLLVTQGRSRADALSAPELGLAAHLLGQFPIEPTRDGRNIITMPFAPDPRTFYPTVYTATKLLLMPSLWRESFGLVAAEAMLNGIPVLASNRGALPETIGDAGFLFDIPARYTSETRDVPTPAEVEPWVETIIRLWDDAAEYDRWSRAAREHAQQWHPDRLAPIYREFFSQITHQPGAPLVPLEVTKG